MSHKRQTPSSDSPAATAEGQSAIETRQPKTLARRSTSSAFAKLPADLRRRVDQAITDRGPGQATYREIFENFRLADHNLAFRSFQRYAAAVANMLRRGPFSFPDTFPPPPDDAERRPAPPGDNNTAPHPPTNMASEKRGRESFQKST